MTCLTKVDYETLINIRQKNTLNPLNDSLLTKRTFEEAREWCTLCSIVTVVFWLQRIRTHLVSDSKWSMRIIMKISKRFCYNQYKIERQFLTSGHAVQLMRVQFSNSMSVPLRRDVAWICGQKPLVFYFNGYWHLMEVSNWLISINCTVIVWLLLTGLTLCDKLQNVIGASTFIDVKMEGEIDTRNKNKEKERKRAGENERNLPLGTIRRKTPKDNSFYRTPYWLFDTLPAPFQCPTEMPCKYSIFKLISDYFLNSFFLMWWIVPPIVCNCVSV